MWRHTLSYRFDPEKLAREMARHGLDGQRLAQKSGIDKSTVSKARRGRAIRWATMTRIVQIIHDEPLIKGAELLS
jgi:transcriptional regulator with XRE-family HTH domain